MQEPKTHWEEARATLEGSTQSPETEDLIDDLAAKAIASQAAEAVPALILCLSLAKSALTQKSVSLAIAVCAISGDPDSVDALVEAFDAAKDDAFLGPAILDALFLLSCRDTLARTELSSLLQRIDKHANPYLVGKAATLCGRLLLMGHCPELRAKLADYVDTSHDDPANDARFYFGCVEINAGTAADDRSAVIEALRRSAVFFRLAAPRPDAVAMGRVVELFLGFCEHSGFEHSEVAISSTRTALLDWPGYESPHLTLFLDGLTRAIDSLNVARKTVEEADRWLDIRAGLVDLAAAMRALAICELGESFSALESQLAGVGEVLVRPRIGKVLAGAIGRRRVEAAVLDCESSGGEACDGLRDLLTLLKLAEVDSQLASAAIQTQLSNLSESVGCHPAEILRGLETAIATGQIGQFAETLGPIPSRLPIYDSLFLETDPTVHWAVCRILEELRELLVPYDAALWNRLRKVVASLVKFAHWVRDTLPLYCLCSEDGGKGQMASEGDLQEGAFQWLRMNFGNASIYESGPIAGGRTDSGLRFDDAEFPIEVKHEFRSVNREHIRESYLFQPSDYASARQRVSFLLILDLRKENAASHRDRVRAERKAGNASSPRSLYTLSDSFWCESLPSDPDIENVEASVVVVGLVPGNRPKPSSQTTYSERPRAARKGSRKTKG